MITKYSYFNKIKPSTTLKNSENSLMYHRTLLSKTVLALSICITSATAMANEMELPQGEHSATEVDTSQPIKAIEHLQSLQHEEPLTFNIPEFQHFKTSNGVPVAFFPTSQLPIVDVDIRFNAGSARDASIRDNSYGLASIVASLLTKGTESLDENEFAEQSEQLGINLGSHASKDQMVISLRSLSDDEHLIPALALMNDMMTKPRFDANTLERIKAQQLLGLKQMAQNPSFVAQRTFNQTLYGDHPYAYSTYGTANSVPTITTDDLQKFLSTYLVVQNATVNLTGDLTLEQAKQVAETLTKNLPNGKPAPKLAKPEPLTSAKYVHVDHDSDQTSIIIGQLGYQLSSDSQNIDRLTQFNIGNDVLAGGSFNSRLMSKVRKELGYTYGIYGSMQSMQTNGPYAISFSTRNEKAGDAIKATLETVHKTLADGITEQEFEHTKNSLINSFPKSFSSNANINSVLGFLNSNQMPDSYITEYIKRIENTNLNEVNQTLTETITPSKFVIVTVGKPELGENFANITKQIDDAK